MHLIGPNRMIQGNEMRHPILAPLHLPENPYQVIVGVITSLPRSFSMIILCKITQAFVIYQRHSWSQNLAGPITIVNWACKNLKWSLRIFPSRCLCIVKLGLFLTFRLANRLHKCLPPWVDAIGKLVVIVVLVAICFKLHLWTLTQCNPFHKWWWGLTRQMS
jgi:hypothetical protein